MTETTVQTPRCEACDADVRSESLFCYNCGAAVTQKPDIPVRRDEARRATIVSKTQEGVAATLPESKNIRPPLRTAASLRKQRRASNRQPARVTWEQPEGSSIAFMITTVVLVLGALVLLALALYLR